MGFLPQLNNMGSAEKDAIQMQIDDAFNKYVGVQGSMRSIVT